MDEDLIVDDCDACGVDVIEGTPHDCPVLGAIVTVERINTDIVGVEASLKRTRAKDSAR